MKAVNFIILIQIYARWVNVSCLISFSPVTIFLGEIMFVDTFNSALCKQVVSRLEQCSTSCSNKTFFFFNNVLTAAHTVCKSRFWSSVFLIFPPRYLIIKTIAFRVGYQTLYFLRYWMNYVGISVPECTFGRDINVACGSQQK